MIISLETALILYQNTSCAVSDGTNVLFITDFFGSTKVIKINKNSNTVTVFAINQPSVEKLISGKSKRDSNYRLIKGSYYKY